MTATGERRRANGTARGLLIALAAGCACQAGLAAQQDSVLKIRPEARWPDSTARGTLPPAVIQELLTTYNDSGTTRIVGPFLLPRGVTLSGTLAVFRGSARIGGELTGRVVVINGDLIVDPGARVSGNVLVVGGQIITRPGGQVEGPQRAYPTPALLTRTGSGLLVIRERPQTLANLASARTTLTTGHFRTTLGIESGGTYNRVEGLPLVLGPSVTREGLRDVEARMDLRGIVWTAPDRTDRRANFGYSARIEFGLGPSRRLTVGGLAYRVITPMEEQPLSGTEAGWSAFLFQRDYRDYFQRQGVTGYARYYVGGGLTVSSSLRYDNERSVPANDPISIFRNDAWRPNPLVDDGHFTSWRLGLEYDTRNDAASPSNGWLLRGYWEHGSSVDAAPLSLPNEVRDPLAPGRYRSSKVWLDARRFARLDPSLRAAVRVVAGGWVSGDPLTVQRRFALGGPDVLPGYGFRSQNCAPASLADPSRPALCDRMILAQLELRTRTRIGLPFVTTDPYITGLQRLLSVREPDIVIFTEAGKSWITGLGPGRVPNDRIPVLREWEADIGFGLDVGGIGVYLAQPLTGSRPLTFTARLQRRF